MSEQKKQKILAVLEEAYPCDLCTIEIADRTGISRITASRYIGELKGEGKIEITRKFGKMIFYRIKKEKVKSKPLKAGRKAQRSC